MSFEGLVANRSSAFDNNSSNFRNLFTSKLHGLIRSQAQLQTFIQNYPHLKGVEFVEQILQHFEFSFQSQWHEKERIPSEGRLVIISNHPLGTLDAVALFKLVSDIRPDVKVVVDQGGEELASLAPIVMPYQCQGDALVPERNQDAVAFLEQEGALIFFPCHEVSRIRPTGVSDTKWRRDFLTLALATQAPILPVFVDGANSALFYGLSALYKPLSLFLLVPEMYKQAKKSVSIRVGNIIPHESFSGSGLPIKTQVKLFKKHLYRIGRGKTGIWPTQAPIAHPESRLGLKQLISSQVWLGETSDQKQIYLYKNQGSCSVMREIGRLREIAFRAVGEGTGQRRDIDRYDSIYSQLVLWDEQHLDIVGAYRLADAGPVIKEHGLEGLYSSSLFDYHPSVIPLLEQGAELGRSFVQPKYWGKRSLDYLWYGIGSYLSKNPQVRYLFGPVSISGELPKAAKDLLVYFFSWYFGGTPSDGTLSDNAPLEGIVGEFTQPLAVSRHPYALSNDLMDQLRTHFVGNDYQADFKVLKNILSNMGCSVPTLYKQYSELCEPGGVRFLGFGIDPEFGNCIDGLILVDTTKIKEQKRRRYIPEVLPLAQAAN